VLEIIVTWKFPCSLPRCEQYTITEGIFRQTPLVAMKTKHRSRKMSCLLIWGLSCI